MELKFKPILSMIKFKDKALLHIQMDLFIKAIYKKVKKMDMEFTNPNLKNTKVNGNKIVNRGKESIK